MSDFDQLKVKVSKTSYSSRISWELIKLAAARRSSAQVKSAALQHVLRYTKRVDVIKILCWN